MGNCYTTGRNHRKKQKEAKIIYTSSVLKSLVQDDNKTVQASVGEKKKATTTGNVVGTARFSLEICVFCR